jgi:hypothetical protein
VIKQYERKYPLNEEAVPTDDDENIRDMAAFSLDMAVDLLLTVEETPATKPLIDRAIAYVARYGQWRQIPLSDDHRFLIRKEVGVEEDEEE